MKANGYKNLRKELNETLKFWSQDINGSDVSSFYDCHLEIYLHENKPFKLYKYVPISYYSLKNLRKQKLHLSANGEFNDIYEGIPADKMNNYTYEDLTLLNNMAYISCFTETNKNMLMWSHYANSHKGICIEYDLSLLNDTDILRHLYPVVYNKKRYLHWSIEDIIKKLRDNNSIKGNYSKQASLDWSLPLFVTKGNDWKYEKEWRIIYTKEEQQEQNIPFDCITGVYLGMRISPDAKEDILEIAENINENVNDDRRKIKVLEPHLDNSLYSLNFTQINK